MTFGHRSRQSRYVKGMLDGIANTEEKRTEYLKIAYRKSCDMDVLLSKLFYFSKLETGNMPFFFRECDVERFLRDYVEEKSRNLRSGGLRRRLSVT